MQKQLSLSSCYPGLEKMPVGFQVSVWDLGVWDGLQFCNFAIAAWSYGLQSLHGLLFH